VPYSTPEIGQIRGFYTYQGQVFDIDLLLEQQYVYRNTKIILDLSYCLSIRYL
jgi:hypothetical protein